MLNSRVPPLPGQIIEGNSETDILHLSASLGKIRTVRKLLKKNTIPVDFQNSNGQTALFCAAYTGNSKVVEVLLKHGADPNHRCHGDYTPTHAACWSGNVKILIMLLAAGGDLRLHDNQDRKPKDWAVLQPDVNKGRQMVQFLDMLQQLISCYNDKKLSGIPPNSENSNILWEVLNNKLNYLAKQSTSTLKQCYKDLSQMLHLLGYGKLCYVADIDECNFTSRIPIIPHTALRTFLSRGKYFNEASLVMERMMWKNVKVTRKKVKENCSSHAGDILLAEMESLSKLHHPNILLLMAVNPASDYTTVSLIFENVEIGSLYHILHEKRMVPNQTNIVEMLLQINDAIIYIHDQNYIHCAITSHSIHFVSPRFAKLSNFGYMIPRDSEGKGLKRPMDFIHFQELYHWLAPEVILDGMPHISSDIYSYCSVVWELLKVQIPWDGYTTEQIAFKVTQKKETLGIPEMIEEPFHYILIQGLKNAFEERKISFTQINLKLLEKRQNLVAIQVSKDKLDTIQSKEKVSLPSEFSLPKKESMSHILKNYKNNLTPSTEVSPPPFESWNCKASPGSMALQSQTYLKDCYTPDQYDYIRNPAKRKFFQSTQSMTSISANKWGLGSTPLLQKSIDKDINMQGDSPRQIHSAREQRLPNEPLKCPSTSPDNFSYPKGSIFIGSKLPHNSEPHKKISRSQSCHEYHVASLPMHYSCNPLRFKPASHLTPSHLTCLTAAAAPYPDLIVPFTRYSLKQRDDNYSTLSRNNSNITTSSVNTDESWSSNSVNESLKVSSQSSYPCSKEWYAGRGSVQGLISTFESNESVDQNMQGSWRKCRHSGSPQKKPGKNLNSEKKRSTSATAPSFIIERHPSLGSEYGDLEISASSSLQPSRNSPNKPESNSRDTCNTNGRKQLASEIPTEDLYFDDDLNDSTCQEDHLKLLWDKSQSLHKQIPKSTISSPPSKSTEMKNDTEDDEDGEDEDDDDDDDEANSDEDDDDEENEDKTSKNSLGSNLSIHDGEQNIKVIKVKAEPGYSCTVRTESNCLGDGTHHVTLTKTHLESGKEEVVEGVVHAEAVQHHIVMEK